MALEGTLKDFALPDIFQLIGLQKKTGMLYLKNDEDEVTISFKDGTLVGADSKNKRLEGRLGTMLVRSGLITEGQLLDVLEKQKQTLQRLGVLLVNEGQVKKEDLKKALDLQVTQIIYRVFRWEDAYYRFDQEDEIDYDRENVTPVSAESILMEGMRIIDEWPIVEKSVRSLAAVYEKVPVDQPVEIEGAEEEFDPEADDFDFDLGGGGAAAEPAAPTGETIKLTREEGAVYELLDGERSLEDVMYLARMSEFDTAKAVYDLLSRDLVREKGVAGPAGEAGASVAAQTSAPAEASPALVAGLMVVVSVLALAGALFFRLNPINGSGLVPGMRTEDVDRQAIAATASRLDRIAYALESHRLAMRDEHYAQQLEDLADLGFLEVADLQSTWGEPIEYRLVADGQGYELTALDADGSVREGLRLRGGRADTEGAMPETEGDEAESADGG